MEDQEVRRRLKVFDEAELAKLNKAIIIKGNPKYLRNFRVKRLSQAFYNEIRRILEEKGYVVEFDDGKPYTSPKVFAAVWVAHSRGIDRLRFGPDRITKIVLQTMDHDQEFESNDERGLSRWHYQLSDKDRELLAALPDVRHLQNEGD